MKGYKLLRKIDGKLYSFNSRLSERNIKNGSCIEYKIGEKTYPKEGCGPLCLFASFQDAINNEPYHSYSDEYFTIHECEYEPSDEISIWSIDKDPKSIEDIAYICGIDKDDVVLAKWIQLI